MSATMPSSSAPDAVPSNQSCGFWRPICWSITGKAFAILKKQLSPKDFEEMVETFGFKGINMFEGLAFDPFLQIASEPYHLLFLGILKFFFKRIIKEKLKPYQRDQVNFLIQQFIFPGNTGPSIRFDVTTDTKNFSITTMQAIGSAFVYVLNQLDVGDELVLFWAKLNGTVQQIFGPLNKDCEEYPNQFS